jgi:hypothetical protein
VTLGVAFLHGKATRTVAGPSKSIAKMLECLWPCSPWLVCSLRLDFEFSAPDANQPARDKPPFFFFDLDRLTAHWRLPCHPFLNVSPLWR